MSFINSAGTTVLPLPQYTVQIFNFFLSLCLFHQISLSTLFFSPTPYCCLLFKGEKCMPIPILTYMFFSMSQQWLLIFTVAHITLLNEFFFGLHIFIYLNYFTCFIIYPFRIECLPFSLARADLFIQFGTNRKGSNLYF